MSGFTLATIRGNLNDLLLEDISGGYWSIAEKNNYINMGLLVTAGEMQFKQQTQNFDLATGVTFYPTPTDMLVPLRVRYNPITFGNIQNVKLFPADIPELEEAMFGWRVAGASEPSRFIFRGHDLIQIWPAPDPSHDESTMPFDYVPYPAVLVKDTDIFDGPLIAAEAATELAAFFCEMSKDPTAAMGRMANFLKILQSARADFDRDNTFKTVKLRPSDRYNKAHHSTKFRRVYP